MVPGFLIVFRETLEVALIVGIIVSFLSRTGQRHHNRVVFAGVGTGIVVSILGAVLFQAFAGGFEGRASAIFEGVTMWVGAVLLTTMILWMMKQRRVAETLRSRVAAQIEKPHRIGLFFLVFVAVLREGIETVIFLSAAGFAGGAGTLLGGAIGMIVAIALGYALFVASLNINLKWFFRVTNVLLILFAGGLVAYGTHELIEAGVVPPIVEEVWNLNPAPLADGSYPLLHEKGAIGVLFKTLFGYNGNPALIEILGYLGYLGFVGLCWYRIGRKSASAMLPRQQPA